MIGFFLIFKMTSDKTGTLLVVFKYLYNILDN